MNFEFSEEQQMLKESMQRWLQDNYSFDQRQIVAENADGFSRKHWQTFAELGWLSIPFSEKNGGYNGSIIDIAAMMEEMGKAIVLEPMMSTVLQFGGLLEASSNTELASELVPKIIDGTLLGAVATYEAQARFDLSDIANSAVKNGNDYVLSGEKCIVPGGAHADYLIVSARTVGQAADEAGISLFLLPRDTPGLSFNAQRLMDGQQAADITIDNVKVAVDQMLCREGEGYALLQKIGQTLDVALSAEALGIMHKLNYKTVEYSKTRQQFGVAISSFQALQHRMVDTFMGYEQTKSLLYAALCELTDGATKPLEVSKTVNALRTIVAKYGKLVGDEAIQIHGGMGLTDELDVGHYVKRLMMINLQFGNGDFFQHRFNQLAYKA